MAEAVTNSLFNKIFYLIKDTLPDNWEKVTLNTRYINDTGNQYKISINYNVTLNDENHTVKRWDELEGNNINQMIYISSAINRTFLEEKRNGLMKWNSMELVISKMVGNVVYNVSYNQ